MASGQDDDWEKGPLAHLAAPDLLLSWHKVIIRSPGIIDGFSLHGMGLLAEPFAGTMWYGATQWVGVFAWIVYPALLGLYCTRQVLRSAV